MQFHEKLKKERNKHHLSQQDLADKLNIARQSISKWENERGYPSIEALIKLSDIFDITIDELLKGDDNLKEKIVKDSKKLKFPTLFNIGELVGLSGLILLITHYILRAIHLTIDRDILPFVQSNVILFIAISMMLISWLTYETFGKIYK